jgi:tetratricopeptide (TPR) repeat protein
MAGQHIVNKSVLYRDDKSKYDKLCRQAIGYLEKSIKLYPGGKHTEALSLLANTYYNYNYDISSALNCYAKCLSYANHFYTPVYENTQEVANSTNKLLEEKKTDSSPQEILKACDEILKAVPDFGDIIHLKAVIYGKYLNDISSSIQWFEEANSIEKFEKSAEFYKDMGIAYSFAKKVFPTPVGPTNKKEEGFLLSLKPYLIFFVCL